MVQARELGRHIATKVWGWIRTLWAAICEGFRRGVSKVRALCKSIKDDG